jgi:hypothetical protein
MKQKTLLLLFIVILFSCTGLTPVSGTGSETDTGCVIVGLIKNADSLPVSGADIILHDQRIVSIAALSKTKNANSLICHATTKTDSNGFFRIDSVAAGNFLIEINDHDSSGGILPVQIIPKDTLKSANGALLHFGTIVGHLDTLVDNSGNTKVIIPELNRAVTIDSLGSFILPAMPVWNYHVRVTRNDSGIVLPTDTAVIPVSEKDTTVIINFGSETGGVIICGNLIAHWSFDSSYNNSYYDKTGHGYNAPFTGTGLSSAIGIVGNALNCADTNFGITVTNSTAGFNLKKYSVEFLYYCNVDPATQIDIGQYLFGFQKIQSGVYNGYGIYVNNTGHIDFGQATENANSYVDIVSKTVLRSQTWYHIVATYDSVSMRLFVNGAIEDSASNPGGFPPPGADAQIGFQLKGDGTRWLFVDGRLDEMKIYNCALDSQAVMQKYNRYF